MRTSTDVDTLNEKASSLAYLPDLLDWESRSSTRSVGSKSCCHGLARCVIRAPVLPLAPKALPLEEFTNGCESVGEIIGMRSDADSLIRGNKSEKPADF